MNFYFHVFCFFMALIDSTSTHRHQINHLTTHIYAKIYFEINDSISHMTVLCIWVNIYRWSQVLEVSQFANMWIYHTHSIYLSLSILLVNCDHYAYSSFKILSFIYIKIITWQAIETWKVIWGKERIFCLI